MLQESRIEELISQAYAGVPSLDCQGCPGDCCVSPTMTAPEFVRMMHWARQHFTETRLIEILRSPSREHLEFADNVFCRFQGNNGLCTNYEGRALACRLHGHEAMRAFATSDSEFCHRNPPGNTAMLSEQVEPLLENIRQTLVLAGISYEPPYFLLSLNLESWIDLAYHSEWAEHRPTLAPTSQYLSSWLELPPMRFRPCHTTLEGKLKAIDRLFDAIETGIFPSVGEILREIREDFPSCGSYYLEESKAMDQMFREQATAKR
ncbi:MAG TPA: YkgJ family cysteine cluster protein [Fibrobacteraceae bacterium]|nr:YkgJ family cysteine cluster protein [Fibrobacteraceae bacterium]